MTIPRFFLPLPIPAGDCAELPAALAHHATRVLRLRDHADIVLFDGSGIEVTARLSIQGKTCRAELLERRQVSRESPLRTVLVQALASGEKMDWIVQKAVELGVTAVMPVSAERCVPRLSGERAEKRLAHWRHIAIAACEQSGRNHIPQIAPLLPLQAYLETHAQAERLILSPHDGIRLAALPEPRGAIHILIGPEGGWTDEELNACRRAGCVSVSLGPRVLRTETAGLAMLAALHARWGDF